MVVSPTAARTNRRQGRRGGGSREVGSRSGFGRRLIPFFSFPFFPTMGCPVSALSLIDVDFRVGRSVDNQSPTGFYESKLHSHPTDLRVDGRVVTKERPEGPRLE